MKMSSETWKVEKDLCRCCHAEGSFTSLAEPSHDLPQAETFSEMLRRCFDIDICAVEGMYSASTYIICEPCILQLRDASTFKQQVLRCEERFRDMFRNAEALGDINVEEEEVDIIEYDAPLASTQSAETGDNETDVEETDQVNPQKEMKGPEEITSNVDLNQNTSINIKTREVNEKRPTNKSYNLRKRNQIPKMSKNVFICNDCGNCNGNERTLAVHIGSNEKLNQDNNLKLTECAYQTETLDSLELHSKLHYENPFICDTCGYTAKKKHVLMQHLRIHTGDKPYSCSFCEYKCALKQTLTVHFRIHTGEKPYSCSFCEFKFAAKTDLTKHLRIHTGDKPYSCSFCEYKCARKCNLNKHLRIHTGEKPYSCSFCEYKCTTKSSLTRHLRSIHTGVKQYSCSLCEHKFVSKTNLKKHIRIHKNII